MSLKTNFGIRTKNAEESRFILHFLLSKGYTNPNRYSGNLSNGAYYITKNGTIQGDTEPLSYMPHITLFSSIEEAEKFLNDGEVKGKIVAYKVIKDCPWALKGDTITEKDGKVWETAAQYPEFLEAVVEKEYKAGDWFVIRTLTDPKSSNPLSGKIGAVICAKSVSGHGENVWVTADNDTYVVGGSWPLYCLREATWKEIEMRKEEIEVSKEILFKGYKLEIKDGTANFGCQSFTLEEVEGIKRLVDNGATISFDSQQVTGDKLERIIKLLTKK